MCCLAAVNLTKWKEDSVWVKHWKTSLRNREKVKVGFVLMSTCLSQLQLHYSVSNFCLFWPPTPPDLWVLQHNFTSPLKCLISTWQHVLLPPPTSCDAVWIISWQEQQRDPKDESKSSIYRVSFLRRTGGNSARLQPAGGRRDGDSERRAPLVRPLSRGDGQVALPLTLLVVALLHQTGHVLEQGLWVATGSIFK